MKRLGHIIEITVVFQMIFVTIQSVAAKPISCVDNFSITSYSDMDGTTDRKE